MTLETTRSVPVYRKWLLAAAVPMLFLFGCAEPRVRPSDQHIKPPAKVEGVRPELSSVPDLPVPVAAPKQETYSVVVNNVPARDLLFALARDARVDIDIASDIDGNVTLNALNQTLPQLLDRIARQIDMRWEVNGKTILISRDTPVLRNYRVDYVNLSRQASNAVNVATQIAGSSSVGSSGGGGASAASNNSLTSVTSKSNHEFWDTLIANVKDLLRETDRVLPEGSFDQTQQNTASQQTTGTGAQPAAAAKTAAPATSLAGSPNPASMDASSTTTTQRSTFREAASVIANRETGIIAVRATGRQHEKVREFLDRVLNSARRQVLIEATIVEVSLNDQSQTGVDWKSVALASGFTFRQNLMGTVLDKALPDATRTSLISSVMGDTNLTSAQKDSILSQIVPGMTTYTGGGTFPLADTRYTGGAFPLTSQNSGITIGYGKGSSFVGALGLLSQFGRTKVISSPKITALNNQPAVLRVVDNLVYFSVSGSTSQNGTSTVSSYTSTTNTVAVGFVMSLIPQIDDGNVVTLTVRPTISRLIGYAKDPNPSLVNVANLVPIVQTREMESVMKVPTGNIVMMGGLMEDTETRENEGLPVLGDIPGAGKLFSTRNNKVGKTELVVFLRPIVITDPSLEGDYQFAKDLMPGKDFFNQPVERKLSLPKLPGLQQESGR